MSARVYGTKPYSVAVVHGGPGALGSVAGIARRLSARPWRYGVIEPMQSRRTIADLIEELHGQIVDYCDQPVTLVGHSWGAWLVAFVAARYPAAVRKIVLVGCGPLEVEYVECIGTRRKANMTEEETAAYDRLVVELNSVATADRDGKLSCLGQLVAKADNYASFDLETDKLDEIPPNGEMYSRIWPEAAKMREDGELLRAFEAVQCPIVLIQGAFDPHPIEGVVEPLAKRGIAIKPYVLDRCGHTPWKERFSHDEFFEDLSLEVEVSRDRS